MSLNVIFLFRGCTYSTIALTQIYTAKSLLLDYFLFYNLEKSKVILMHGTQFYQASRNDLKSNAIHTLLYLTGRIFSRVPHFGNFTDFAKCNIRETS